MVIKKPAPIDTLLCLAPYRTGQRHHADHRAPCWATTGRTTGSGLALWTFNVTPYLYLEINGLCELLGQLL